MPRGAKLVSEWSRKLEVYLADTGLSKKQLALKLDVSINTLQKWCGKRKPSPEYADRIVKLLEEGVSIREQGVRQDENPVVISLVRTVCPFCESEIERFKDCLYCGQHFVWLT